MSNYAAVMALSPVAYWTLDETTGTTVNDAAGSSDGTYVGSPTLGVDSFPGDTGAAMQSASGKYADLGDVFGSLSEFSIHFWFRLPSGWGGSSWDPLVTKGDTSWRIARDSTSSMRLQFNINSAGTYALATGNHSFTNGDWYHVVATRSSTARAIYVNGAVSGSAASAGVLNTQTQAVRIGHNAEEQSRVSTAVFGEVAVFDYALSAAQVEGLYDAGVSAATNSGTIAGTSPSYVGDIEGTVTVPPVEGVLDGESPAYTGTIYATVGDGTTGQVVGTSPGYTGAIEGVTAAVYPTTFTIVRRNHPAGRTATPALLPAPVPPSIEARERAIAVLAHPMPALTPTNKRNRPGVDYQLLRGTPVRPHIFVDGVDITFLRDHPTIIGDWSSSDPLTDDAAFFTMPQIGEGDELGIGDLAPFDLDRDPTVDIVLIREADGALLHVWDGHIAREGDRSGEGTGRSFICEGSIMAAAHAPHMPPTIMDETDIGIVIPRVLNGTPGRRFHPIAETITGITTSKRGHQGQTRLDYVEEILATAYDETGNQVTLTKIGPRRHALVLKTDTAWTARVVKGAHGVNLGISRDQSMRWDAIFGEGTAPNGGGWGNWFFPGLDLFIPPPYPYTPGSNQTISVGDTDAGTLTGDGVTLATTRLADLGYPVTPGPAFTTAHAAATLQLQRTNGLLDDGIIGPQTWTSMFTPGLDEIDLQAVRLPLASKPWVLPNRYAANGAVIDANPLHDPVPVPKAPNIKFGADITKTTATELARRMLIANGEAAWTGPLTLTSDPIGPDGQPFSRLLLREGDRILVEGHDGDTVLRVADASRDGVSVTLGLDERNRDALTLAALRERDMEARQELNPRPGSPRKISSLTRDHIVQFEEESKAGQIPTYPVNGNVGLWSVFPIVVSQTGRIAKLDVLARNATTTFVIAFFGKEIQPQRLAALVPDPIASSDGWREHEETLILDHAWIETYGGPGSLAGYSPWQQRDGRPVTGNLRDYSGLEFTSERRGYLWVAAFSSASCNISGRAYPAIPQ